jgi:putative ABC transport system permease protein
MQSARIALRNISRQKKRTMLLAGAIAFGVLVITLIGSFTAGILVNVQDNFTSIFGGHIYVSGQELSPSGKILARMQDGDTLRRALEPFEAEIAEFHTRSRAFGTIIWGSKTELFSMEGIDWETEPDLLPSLNMREIDEGLFAQPDGIILPESVADELEVLLGETVIVRMETVTGQVQTGEFRVAGIYFDNADFSITGGYAHLSYLNPLLGLTAGEFQYLNVTLNELSDTNPVTDALYAAMKETGVPLAPRGDDVPEDLSQEEQMQMAMSAMFGFAGALGEEDERWEGTKFSITSLNDIMEPVLTLIDVIKGIGTTLFLILVGITMIGLLNTFRMILIERTKEIGTVRAIGMQREGVRNIFLFEALFLALLGAILGILASLGGSALLGLWTAPTDSPMQLFTASGSFSFPFVPLDVIQTVVILSVITLVSAFMPARKAAKMEPAHALRTNY